MVNSNLQYLFNICSSSLRLEAQWHKKAMKMVGSLVLLFYRFFIKENLLSKYSFCKLMMYVLLGYVGKVLCREKGFL